nr:ATP-binding cassette domain-containing protein [Bifidobacterium aemilianum]
MLSLISGLDTATGGEVLYRGQNVGKLDRDNYRAHSVGTIFQGYNLLTNATALENIVLSMNISGVKGGNKKQTALELLERIGIDRETANRKVLQLSGGEQQRVGIARVLAHNPDVIIADEPTGNLDRDTRKTIMDILARLAHDEGKCVIVVTHSQSVTDRADDVLGILQGTLSRVR